MVKKVKECANCGIEFTTYVKTKQYCSQKCRTRSLKIIKKCKYCKKEFLTYKNKGHQKNYCSSVCTSNAKAERFLNAICINCKQPFTRNKYALNTKSGVNCCSNKCKNEYYRGINHPKYNGGKKPKGRTTVFPGYTKWQNEVFRRDNFSCVICNANIEKENLYAHHLKAVKQILN